MLATIILSLALLAIAGAIIRSLIRKKKNGQSTCGCGCARCAMAEVCHKKES